MKQAKWIWLAQEKADEYAVFQTEIFLEKQRPIWIDISVFGQYTLYVNGKLAAFGQYADYIDYKVFDKVELTSFLRAGANCIRLIAWHIGASFSTHKEAGAGVLYEIYDGDGVLAYSSANTDCALCNTYVSYKQKVITTQLGYSYTYDFRGEDTPYAWRKAVEREGAQTLHPRPNEKLSLEPLRRATLIDKEKAVYDLGRECSGFLYIRFQAAAGEPIRIGYGEHIEDEDVRHFIYGRDFTVDLIGNGKEVCFLGTFLRLGCRYLKVMGDAQVVELGICETPYPLTVKPYAIGDERRMRIYEVSLRTLALCLHEHYEDCPWREQSMYIMDSRIQMRCGYYAFENPECARSAILLMSKGQKGNGLFDLCFPADVPITIPSYALAFPATLYEYVAHTKDVAFALPLLDNVEKAMDYFFSRLEENGLYKTVSVEGLWHFYEWAGDLDNALLRPDWTKIERDEYDVLINAFLSLACLYCKKLYALAGEREKEAAYEEKRVALNARLREVFFVEEVGLFKTRAHNETYSALANALCILCGAFSATEASAVADKLIDGYDGWVETTLSMNLYRYDALLQVNKEKYAGRILAEIDKTYGYMLDKGATSFWETIIGANDFGWAGSLCHGWSAIPAYYYRILGVTGKAEPPIE